MPGKFIAIDGPNGAGKTTLAQATAQRLRGAGIVVVETREPSEGPIGRLVRELEGTVDSLAFACLIASDRYAHVKDVIAPALDAGHTVVCDRYLASSLALQVLDGVSDESVWTLNQWVQRPDIFAIVTASVNTLEQRLSLRHHQSYFEVRFTRSQEVEAFRCAAHLLINKGSRVLVLDTSRQSIDECAAKICAACE